MKKKILGGFFLLLLLGFSWYFYRTNVATTKIVTIGFPDFMLEKIVSSNDNNWIKIENLPTEEFEDLCDYKFALVRAHGTGLSKAQVQLVKEAQQKGTKVYMAGVTNPEFDISNIEGKELDYISTLLQNGCAKNYRSLLNYVRNDIDHKIFFNKPSNPPHILPRNFFFHLDDEAVFSTLSEYENYYKNKGFYHANAPKVAFLSGNINIQNSNPEHSLKLITNLEAKGLNVYPIKAYGKQRLSMLKELKPDLVIFRPHGRLSGNSEETERWLIEQNIPVYAPITVYEDYEEWENNPQGMAGGMLSMSVVLPELDGAVMPYALIAKFKNEKGYKIFDVIPGRAKEFAEAVAKRIALKKKSNADKKLAIYYFKGAGKSALTASGLEVISSLYNTLKALKAEGYNLGNLPKTKKEFGQIIMAKGAVLAPYALGAFDNYLKTGNPELVEKSVYEEWCKTAMPKDMYQTVVDRYGEAPGKYMSIEKEGKQYIAVTAIRFGNVCLLPQPMSGVGSDTDKIVHGAKMAPPHPYIASYLWSRNAFGADAICHFGTHGSLEFTPHKQVALSSHDWPDRLVGTTPHFYLYTISNIGEGITAKRRSYATLVTHLTPPFMRSGSRGDLEMIHEKIHHYTIAPENSPLKRQYALSIRKMVEKQNINNSLKLDTAKNYVYTAEDVQEIHEFLQEINEEKVTSGVYTLGVPYAPHKLKETTELMAIDAIAFNLAKIDAERKKISLKDSENASFVSHKYSPQARQIIRKSMSGKALEPIIASVLTKQELKFAHQWKNAKEKAAPSSMTMAMMMGQRMSKVNTVDKKQLPELLVQLCEDDANRDYILKMQSKQVFENASELLKEDYRIQMQKMAKKVKDKSPEMYAKIMIGSQKDMLSLLKMMQDSTVYAETFRLLSEKGLKERILKEKEQVVKMKVQQLEDTKSLRVLQLAFANELAPYLEQSKKSDLQKMLGTLSFYEKNVSLFGSCEPKLVKILQNMTQDSIAWNKQMTSAKTQLSRAIDAIEQKEANYAQAILLVENSIRSVSKYKQNLAQSTTAELAALINALGGGFTPPSSGGDPIVNPRALPTGRNMYAIDAERTPSEEAWEVGKKLAKSLLESEIKNKGRYPQKISFTLWATNFISTEGATIAQILYLLGVEPVRDGYGTVRNLKLIPTEVLGRPRIDVVVQTSGQLRDLAASRMSLLNQAILLASEANDVDSLNYVAAGRLTSEKYLLAQGFSPKDARDFAKQRVFGGVNGNYGTGIMGLVESGDRWEDEKEIAETYINNMGAVYDTRENWGVFHKGVFEAALQNTEVVVQPRSGNTWGALSLDHVYEFMGGLNLAVRHVTGKDPSAYFNDFRNVSNPRMQTLEESIGVETNSTVFNPKYIKELLKEEASALEGFAEIFRNTYGWNVMKPKAIDKYIWDSYYDIYIKDKYKLDLPKVFKEKNPYALQEMTAVMLETVRKGYWKASPEQIKEMVQMHTQLVKEYKAGCTGFICDNAKLREFITEKAGKENASDYLKAIKAEREIAVDTKKDNVVLKKEEEKNKKTVIENVRSRNTIGWWIGGALLLLAFGFFIWKKRK